LDRVAVVLGASSDDILAALDLHGSEPVICERWEEGQSASLACGLAELADAEAVVVVLGDQPRLSPEAIARVLGARAEGVDAVRASYGGQPGHPVLIERSLFGRLRDVSGDHGARNLLLSVKTREVPCDDLGGGEDVDTVAQLDALRTGGRLA
jgi:CTP:molybdopterin cytidylyltransferase MocA